MVIVGALADLPRVPTWSRGRAVLVGDAAHATSPSSGQGASIAIEGSVQLARCLRDFVAPSDAFAAYALSRRSRMEKIIAAGANISSRKAPGPLARVLRDLLLPVATKVLVRPDEMTWQSDYLIDWDEPVPAARIDSPL
ncbi:MAG: FAD-dependent monooxygenase [Kibdelosporangium sp.]